jgi:hypothetical protein
MLLIGYGPERHPHLSPIVRRAFRAGIRYGRNARPLARLENAVWNANHSAFLAWFRTHEGRLEGMMFSDAWQLWTLGRVVRPSWKQGKR